MPFEQVWERICHELAPPKLVRNWTAANGHIGRDFIARQGGSSIVCVLASGIERRVPRKDFQAVDDLWPTYVIGQTPRREIVSKTYHSKYIISILREFLDNDILRA